MTAEKKESTASKEIPVNVEKPEKPRRGRPPGSKNKSDAVEKAPPSKPARKGRNAKPKDGKKKENPNKKRGAALRSYPTMSFQDALVLPEAIQKYAGGHEIWRLTLFQHLGKGADSSLSRALVTNSAKYGLTVGNHSAEKLSLTPDGQAATDPEASPEARFRARVKLAIQDVEPFNALYERFRGKLPSQQVMRDFLSEQGYEKSIVPQLVETFIVNAKSLNLLQDIAGAERLLPIDHVLEQLPKEATTPRAVTTAGEPTKEAMAEKTDWDKICFYITAIGEPDTIERKHSDLFLSQIVEPALAEFGLKVVRADAIAQPGMIGRQVLVHAVRAKLVITDLSFHNASAFYELSLRHACRKATVHIIRHEDKLPADVNQFRTIRIDNRDIYSLLPKLESYRAELAMHVRKALENPDSIENPISTFVPELRVVLPP